MNTLFLHHSKKIMFKANVLLIICFLLITFTKLNAIEVFYSKKQDISTSVTTEKAEQYLKLLQEAYAKGDYDLHKIYSDSLLLIANENKLAKMQILALSNQAVFYNNQSETLEAIKRYHEALEKCELIPEDFKTKVVVLVNMGNTYNNMGSFAKSNEYMQKVISLLDKHENSDHIRTAALIGIANNYSELKDYQNEILYALQAKEIAKKTNNASNIAAAVNNISKANIHLKEYQKALDYAKQALQLPSLDLPTKTRARLLLNAGIANFYLNDFDNALDYLSECAAQAKDKKILEIEMLAQEFIAKVYESKKDYKASVEAQNIFSELRELHLNNKKQASNADLSKTIDVNKAEFRGLNERKNKMILFGAILLLLLGFLLFFFVIRKRKLDKEQKKLRQQYLILQQDFNNFKTESSASQIDKSIINKNKLKPYKNSSLTTAIREDYKNKIVSFMKTEKPYLNPDITQSELAKKVNINSHNFSEILYYNFEQNFYSFINSYRVLEVQNRIKNLKYKDSKIMAIAFDSGFNSKTSFNRAFKNHTGITPSEYRQNVKKLKVSENKE